VGCFPRPKGRVGIERISEAGIEIEDQEIKLHLVVCTWSLDLELSIAIVLLKL